MASNEGPMYIRLNRNPYDNITPEDVKFVPGEPVVLKEGSDVAVFACGIMVSKALEAAKQLEGKISVKVVNVPYSVFRKTNMYGYKTERSLL